MDKQSKVIDKAANEETTVAESTFTFTQPCVYFSVSNIPSPHTAGTWQSVLVEAKDAGGNTALGYTGTIVFTTEDQMLLFGEGIPILRNGTVHAMALPWTDLPPPTLNSEGSKISFILL